VPARGGSKGIPRKNLAPFLGVSLLERACRCGLAADSIWATVVSTDDDEMADVARRAGARVPFMRPAALAADDTPSIAVVQHALRALEGEDEHYDAVCLLQPTHPLRLPEDVDAACARLAKTQADAVVSVARVPHQHHPNWTYFLGAQEMLEPVLSGPVIARRQDLPSAWYREGTIYVTRADVIRAGSLYGSRLVAYRIPPERSGGIDTPEELAALEARARSLGWSG
jgi:CMP-N-acetylneuraminic acid synthetase